MSTLFRLALFLVAATLCACTRAGHATIPLSEHTLALVPVADQLVAISSARADNVAVLAANGTVVRSFRVAGALDAVAAPDGGVDVLANDASGSRIVRIRLDGTTASVRRLGLRLDGLGPEAGGSPLGVVRRAGGTDVVREDGRLAFRFDEAVAHVRNCTLGVRRYLVAASSRHTELVDIDKGSAYGVAVGGSDANCIPSLSGTVLAVLEGDRLAIVALPALQEMATLNASASEQIVASGNAAYLLSRDAAAAEVFARDTLDFREQLIHDIHFK